MTRFLEPSILNDTGNTKQDLRDYVENLRPTIDLVDTATMDVANDKIKVALLVPRYEKFTFDFNDFSRAATTSLDKIVLAMGAGGIIEAVKIIVTTPFEKAGGTPFTVCTLAVGTTPSTPNEFISAANMKVISTTAPADSVITTTANRWQIENGLTDILAVLDCGGENTDQATQGQVDIWLKFAVGDSEL